jgi:hypothetical protein
MSLFSIKSKVNRRSKVSEKFHNVGGAYVSCFISLKDFEAASLISCVGESLKRNVLPLV